MGKGETEPFRTIFPPLLIALQQHLDFVYSVVQAAVTGDTPESLDSSYWDWYRAHADLGTERLREPELLAAWQQLAQLHEEMLLAADTCVAAVARGDEITARTCVAQVFACSRNLIGLIIGGSLREINGTFAERERRLAERYEREFLEAAHIGRFAVKLADQTFFSVDQSFAEIFAMSTDEIVGQDLSVLFEPDIVEQLLTVPEGGRPTRIIARSASDHVPSLEIVAYREAGHRRGTLQGFAVNASVADRDARERKLLSAAIDCSDQVVLITNARQEIVFVNPAFVRLSGYSRDEVLGRNPRFLQGPDTSQATRDAIRDAISAGNQTNVELLNYGKHGQPYWIDLSIVPVRDDHDQITHWISIARDISDRKEQEKEVTRLAMEDYLTGLLNRRAGESRLAVEWSRARRDKNQFAVALVDIDRFKMINDQYGHKVGDEVLVQVARTLSGNLRGGDWIARWGGEEFLICLQGLDRAGAVVAGERTRTHLKSKAIRTSAGELKVTASFGIALYSSDVDSVEELVARADALLYEAKNTGRDKVLVGSSGSGAPATAWEASQVQSALNENRVLPVFQPIVDLRTGEVVGEEALARIRTPDDVMVQARRFIEAAEALRLVGAIDRRVTTHALERTAEHVEKTTALQAYFINLSAQSLADKELVTTLREQAIAFRMLRGGVNPMVIEITERQTADMSTLRAHLDPLVQAGFRVALDDFGSGYSSFMYLAELPVHFLKIEGWMVRSLNREKRTRKVVETIVGTAKTFNLMTVAECVEDQLTAQVLCDMGVDWAQGHYFSKPLLPSGEAVD